MAVLHLVTVAHALRAPINLATPSSMRTPRAVTVLSLPTVVTQCTVHTAWKVAAASGCAAITGQVVLTALFKRDKATADAPAFYAYNVVAGMYMLVASAIGAAALMPPTSWPVGAAGRLLQPSGPGRFLTGMLLGELLLWDLPMSLWIHELRKPVMLIHHAAMACAASIVIGPAPIFYACFYFGISEFSSVPLAVNEHYVRLARTLEHDVSANRRRGVPTRPKDVARLKRVKLLRHSSQTAGAALFILLRATIFPLVTIRGLLPDVLAVVGSGAAIGAQARWLQAHLALGLCFTALQLFWFVQVIRVAVFGEARPE